MTKTQNTIVAAAVAAIGAWVCYLSYTQEPAQAFLFPRVISTAFVILAALALAQTALGREQAVEGVTMREASRFLPGLVVLFIYVFWAANTLGFYTATAACCFVMLSLYDPAPHDQVMTWLRRALITAGFVAVMYGLFAEVLKVYTPREIFF